VHILSFLPQTGKEKSTDDDDDDGDDNAEGNERAYLQEPAHGGDHAPAHG